MSVCTGIGGWMQIIVTSEYAAIPVTSPHQNKPHHTQNPGKLHGGSTTAVEESITDMGYGVCEPTMQVSIRVFQN